MLVDHCMYTLLKQYNKRRTYKYYVFVFNRKTMWKLNYQSKEQNFHLHSATGHYSLMNQRLNLPRALFILNGKTSLKIRCVYKSEKA